jgi:UDP-N-acetylmuramate--alanine ligase
MKKKVFMVGVGGIGVSSLAKYLHKQGYEIYGSNWGENENTRELVEKYNLHFYPEEKKENITKEFDFIIYTPAAGENNLERVRARELGIREYSYPEFLGKISQEKFTISVAGTNGKTTTTTIMAELLDYFEKSPTVVVGGVVKKFNSNFLLGDSDLFVVESCEYKDSFLHLQPNIIIITNITPDHLDHFGTFKNYKKVFQKFLKQAKGSRKILICDENNENLKELVKEASSNNFEIIDYQKYQVERMTMPGEYNRENAKAALALIDFFDLDLGQAQKYLAEDFQGPAKRFDYLGKTK